jgi:KDEL-tailed cysteine endopeptidase
MDQGFEYIMKQGSLCTEKEYPYSVRLLSSEILVKYSSHSSCSQAANGACPTPPCQDPVTIDMTGYKDVTKGSEGDLMTAANIGPVSVAIEADQSSFQFYSGGVMSGQCGDQLDHGVLVVGYGTDSTSNQDYWTVKNSWGANWGEEGYIRLIRGINQV